MGRFRTGFLLKLAKKRTTFSGIFLFLTVLLGKGEIIHITAGMPFILIGAALRGISAGIIKKNKVLTKEGPYGACRHPLYLGSVFISVGLATASARIEVFLFLLIFFPLTYIPAMLEEEKYLERTFGDMYLDYKKTVPAFLPKFCRLQLRNFSFRQVIENKEHLNILVIFSIVAFLLIKSYYKF